MFYCPSLLSLFINFLHSCSSPTIFLTFLESVLSLSSDLGMLRGSNFIAASYLRWRRKKQFVQWIQMYRSLQKGKVRWEKGGWKGFFCTKRSSRSASCNNFVFHSLLIHEGKKVRELENLQILLSFTVIPIQTLPPGDSSSRSRLP